MFEKFFKFCLSALMAWLAIFVFGALFVMIFGETPEQKARICFETNGKWVQVSTDSFVCIYRSSKGN